MRNKLDFQINPLSFLRYNLVIVITLILFHILLSTVNYYSELNSFLPFKYIIKSFYLDAERNIPTAYQGLIIFFFTILLFILSLNENQKKSKFFFNALSFSFLFIGLDELLVLHEELIQPTRNLLNTSGFLYFAWVVPYGILATIFAVFFYGFIKTFPPN